MLAELVVACKEHLKHAANGHAQGNHNSNSHSHGTGHGHGHGPSHPSIDHETVVGGGGSGVGSRISPSTTHGDSGGQGHGSTAGGGARSGARSGTGTGGSGGVATKGPCTDPAVVKNFYSRLDGPTRAMINKQVRGSEWVREGMGRE